MIDFYFKSITGFIYQDNYKDSIEEILIMLYQTSSASWSNDSLKQRNHCRYFSNIALHKPNIHCPIQFELLSNQHQTLSGQANHKFTLKSKVQDRDEQPIKMQMADQIREAYCLKIC